MTTPTREHRAEAARLLGRWGAKLAQMPIVAQALADRDARIGELTGALQKINAIRDSIVGCQRVNISEHVYPLVAAIDAAGFEGCRYEDARNNVGTLIERTNAAETQLARVVGALDGLLGAEGCSCDCGHDSDGHEDECERCFACRVDQILKEVR